MQRPVKIITVIIILDNICNESAGKSCNVLVNININCMIVNKQCRVFNTRRYLIPIYCMSLQLSLCIEHIRMNKVYRTCTHYIYTYHKFIHFYVFNREFESYKKHAHLNEISYTDTYYNKWVYNYIYYKHYSRHTPI